MQPTHPPNADVHICYVHTARSLFPPTNIPIIKYPPALPVMGKGKETMLMIFFIEGGENAVPPARGKRPGSIPETN